MAYFNICDNCGSHLDPGEKCDCINNKKKQEELRKKYEKLIIKGTKGQQCVLNL